MAETDPLTYRDAGVDIAAGDALVEAISPLAAGTRRPGALGGLGGFGALFDPRAAGFRDPILVATTDGVGTKLRLAIETGRLGTVGIDLVAMCVNDLLAQGAEPLLFLDYYATGRLDVAAARAVIAGIAEGCRIAGCVLAGGETAEMPGMYAGADFDLAGFALGAVERGAALPRGVAEGDMLLGLAASGVHSNGFSLVRKVAARAGLGWDAPAPFGGESLGAALLEPTRIYVRSLLPPVRAGRVKALAHITGGGITLNLPRVLPEGLGALVDPAAWERPAVFRWLIETARLDPAEAFRTFNCGIGMIAVVAEAEAEALAAELAAAGEQVHRIGRVVPGAGVRYGGGAA